MKRNLARGALFGLLCCLPTMAAKPEPVASDPFGAGHWTLQLTGSYINSNDTVQGGAGTFGANYFVLNGLSVGANVSVYGFHGDEDLGEDSVGGGLDLVARWHFLRTNRLSV